MKNPKLKTAIKYMVWFLINFVACLIPLFITYLSSINKPDFSNLFSSFLSFIISLLSVSLYSYFINTKNFIDELSISELLMVISAIYIGIVIAFYPIYNLNSLLKELVNNNLILFGLSIFSLTLVLAFLLNKPSITKNIEEENLKNKFRKSNETSVNVKKFKQSLSTEGDKS
jgi:hypothetical protein